MLIKLALALMLVLAVSCTGAPAPSTPAPASSAQRATPFVPPKWTRPLPIPQVALANQDYKVAGWDTGLLLVASRDHLADGARQFIAYTSKDGHDWRETAPGGVTELAEPPYRMVAGYGKGGYLLGWTSRGLTVWRTEEGDQWEEIPLDTGDLSITSSADLWAATITAGPRGVLVVAEGRGDRNRGIKVWHSADGRTFGEMAGIPATADAQLVPSNAAEATANGFLLSLSSADVTSGIGQRLLTSDDGVRWQDVATGLSPTLLVNHMSSNASTLVAFAFQPGPEHPAEPLTWYRRDGEWHPATVDPGRLPDAGVVPANQRIIAAVRNWGAGFIAIGFSNNVDSREHVGLVWYSDDGAKWTRMPVRDNGFDAVTTLVDVAATRTTAVLLGVRYGYGDTHEPLRLVMWRTEIPPPPNR